MTDASTNGSMDATVSAEPVSASAANVIEARGLVKRYGALTALNGVSFDVRRGEIFGILGPNGAGKTTLVEILEGLATPSAGTALVLGTDVTRDPTEVKRRIGVQLQSASYHNYLTLREIIELFGSFYPQHADPKELLERVHLGDRANARMKTLSGGMKQRFSIVAALVNNPSLVFFDEPTAGLDPDARRDLWSIVQDVRASGSTVVLTTHYMEEAQTLCDRVAFLDRGAIAALDAPAGLIRSLRAPFRISVVTARPLPAAAVVALPAVSDVSQEAVSEGHVTRMRAHDAPAVVAALTALAGADGSSLLDLEVIPATLEDVFLQVTGRGLEG